MKRNTAKTAALYAAADEARRELRARIHGCERCGATGFALHEICRAGLRRYVAGLPSCVIAVCDPGCHQEVSTTAGPWRESRPRTWTRRLTGS
jgi:hypothetical protein